VPQVGPSTNGGGVEVAVASPKIALGDRSNTADAKIALGDRSNTADALALIEGSDTQGKAPPPAAAAASNAALSPGTLIRQVREVTGHNPPAPQEEDAVAATAAKKEAINEEVAIDSEVGGVNTDAEIGDIDRRLNQLQEFLRQAKEGQAAS